MNCYLKNLEMDWVEGTILNKAQKVELRWGEHFVSLNFPKTLYDQDHILVSGLDDDLVLRTFEVSFSNDKENGKNLSQQS